MRADAVPYLAKVTKLQISIEKVREMQIRKSRKIGKKKRPVCGRGILRKNPVLVSGGLEHNRR
jgi:hypothetical protein